MTQRPPKLAPPCSDCGATTKVTTDAAGVRLCSACRGPEPRTDAAPKRGARIDRCG